MTVDPGEYTATLPGDPSRMEAAQALLKQAGGTLLDWGFNEKGGLDVKFRTTKPVEWPSELQPPKLISAPLVHVPEVAPPKPVAAKPKKKAKKKDNTGMALLLFWLLSRM